MFTITCDFCGLEISEGREYVTLRSDGSSRIGARLKKQDRRWSAGWVGHFHSSPDDAGCYERLVDLIELARSQARELGGIPVADESEVARLRARHRALASPAPQPTEGIPASVSPGRPERRVDGSAGQEAPLAPDLPLTAAGLSPRAEQTLVRLGIVRLEHAALWSEFELRAIDGVGGHSIQQLATALERAGLAFRSGSDVVSVGTRLRELRGAAGLSRQGVAHALAISDPNERYVYERRLASWEKATKAPDEQAAGRLAALYGVTVDFLLCRETRTSTGGQR